MNIRIIPCNRREFKVYNRRMKETMDSIAASGRRMGRGDWDGAERIFLAALTEAEETGDRRAALSPLRRADGLFTASSAATRRNLSSVLGRALSRWEVLPEAAARGTILINAATALAAFGEAQRALPLFREAESLYAVSLGADHPRRRFITTWPRRSMRCIARTRRSGTCSGAR